MRIFISCTCNHAETTASMQQHFKECGRSLGFQEMNIPAYQQGSCTDSELTKELDGILAGVSAEDLIILQLPTGNGLYFDRRFLNKIKAYHDTHVIALLCSSEYCSETSLLRLADEIYASTPYIQNELRNAGFLRREIPLFGYLGKDTDRYTVCRGLTEMVSAFIKNNQKECTSDSDIPICLALHDNDGSYSANTAVVMISAAAHTHRRLVFHIITDASMTPHSQRLLFMTAKNIGCSVIFHFVDEKRFTFKDEWTARFSAATMYRLAMPEILSDLDRVIYLDGDLYICADLEELWNTDLQGKPLGAVRDHATCYEFLPQMVVNGETTRKEYFNAGVLLADLKMIRNSYHLFHDSVKYLKNHNDSVCPDQDAMNYLFRGHVRYLDFKWNRFTNIEKRNPPACPENIVYHYAGDKYFHVHSLNCFDIACLHTFDETFWSAEPYIRTLIQESRMWENHLRGFQKLISILRSQKTSMIFCGAWNHSMHTVARIFHASSQNSLQMNSNDNPYSLSEISPADLAKMDKNTFVVIVNPDNKQDLQFLDSIHLTYGVNYFVSAMLVSAEQGGYLL